MRQVTYRPQEREGVLRSLAHEEENTTPALFIASGLIAWAARISLGFLMGAVLFGYLLRLGILLAAVLLVRDAGWISLPALGATIIVTHLGLLLWELKYVAASLAYPGLKPARP